MLRIDHLTKKYGEKKAVPAAERGQGLPHPGHGSF